MSNAIEKALRERHAKLVKERDKLKAYIENDPFATWLKMYKQLKTDEFQARPYAEQIEHLEEMKRLDKASETYRKVLGKKIAQLASVIVEARSLAGELYFYDLQNYSR
jgi:hypothetical protein